MRSHMAVFSQNKGTFFLLTVTFTFLFLGINFLLLPRSYVAIEESHALVQQCKSDSPTAAQGHMWLAASNVPFLMDELMRINHTVRNELVELDRRRRELLNSTVVTQARVDAVRSMLFDSTRRFLRLRAAVHSYETELRDLKSASAVFYKNWPTVLIHEADSVAQAETALSVSACSVDTCLNWNQCPLGSFLRLCGTGPDKSNDPPKWLSELTTTRQFQFDCSNPPRACLRVTTGVSDTLANCESGAAHSNSPTCLAILTEPEEVDKLYRDADPSVVFMLASPYFPPNRFRYAFDFFVPVWFDLIERGYDLSLTSAFDRLIPGRRSTLLGFSAGRASAEKQIAYDLASLDARIVQSLRQLAEPDQSKSSGENRVHIYETEAELLNCWPSNLQNTFAQYLSVEPGWFPCHDSPQILSQSTFGLVLNTVAAPPSSPASVGWQVQLMLSLASGAIPVLLGSTQLPFGEAIGPDQWSAAVLHVPRGRVHELTAILQSVPSHHLVEMRRRGQILYRRYFQGVPAQVDSLLLAVSRRLGLPQPPAPAWPSPPGFANGQYVPPKHYEVPPSATYQTDFDNFLGPVGPTRDSPRFQANFTGPGGSAHMSVVSIEGGDRMIHPFLSYPSTPWDVAMPSDAAHDADAETSRGLRPINHSINLAGYEFNMDLGGMFPYEQFTVLMLTYNRFEIACRTLEGLLNLPYLHSVVVIWNHPVGPKSNAAWPQLHVPIKVIHAANNSLNNRFLPYDIIQTDAILSLDDDSELRHDEIIFGFRIWREHRDQLVGYPVRSHFWNTTSRGWYYHSDYTCEFSMILTGAAFFHKYYSYAYTFEMPLAVREMVDRYFNCEDLAMNFLVAHLTRKAPIKATLHWSFVCPECTTSLHDKAGHYNQRTTCLNELTKLYGYNPLMYTQYRADSVLFKTRIPAKKQKCFLYI